MRKLIPLIDFVAPFFQGAGNVLSALVLVCLVLMAAQACAPGAAGPASTGQAVIATEAAGSAGLERLQIAAKWLKESESNLAEQYQAVLEANPDKADSLKAGWGSTLDKVGEAVTAYDAAVGAADAKSADWRWDVARGLVSQAAGIALSYGLKAAIGQ